MASVTYDRVFKRFGEVTAVNDMSIEVEDKEFLVLVGPSGCGKTTALRLLAGLEEISEGQILIGDRVVNMAFGLRLRKTPRDDIKRRVEEAADILGIGNLLDRKPRQLSGGQRQRVAVGRAIVREPKVFLFDEPLSNLDAKLRVQTRAEITKLHQRLQTTFIYVTHDQVEAMTMASRIAVMKDGILQQIDTPQKLYDYPANVFVAGFIGSPSMNFFDSKLERSDGKLIIDAGSFTVPVPENKREHFQGNVGENLIFGIRPDDIHDPNYAPPSIQAAPVEITVDVTELMGNEIFVYMLSGDSTFVGRLDPRSKVNIGDKVQVIFNMDNMHLFEKSGLQKRIA
jgi:multiple sugar transport system ATP-binding protein